MQFENLRRVEASFESLPAPVQKQVKFLLKQQQSQTLAQARKDEESILHEMEIIDVLDGETLVYQLFLWNGDGALLVAGKTKEIGVVVQHGFQMTPPNPDLHVRLAAAWAGAAKRLGTQNDFTFGEPELPRVERVRTIDETIADWERRYASQDPKETVNGYGLLESDAWKLVGELSGGWRPLPVRRPSELSEDVAKIFRFILRTRVSGRSMWCFGYPRDAPLDPAWRPLARFTGDQPPTALDALVTLEGAAHPLWCLVSDVLYDIRPAGEVLDALHAQVPHATQTEAWKRIAISDPDQLRLEIQRTNAERLKAISMGRHFQPVMSDPLIAFLAAWSLRLPLGSTDFEMESPRAFHQLLRLSVKRVHGGQLDHADVAVVAAVLSGNPSERYPLAGTLVSLMATLPEDTASKLLTSDVPHLKKEYAGYTKTLRKGGKRAR